MLNPCQSLDEWSFKKNVLVSFLSEYDICIFFFVLFTTYFFQFIFTIETHLPFFTHKKNGKGECRTPVSGAIEDQKPHRRPTAICHRDGSFQ